jgi:hypothetical protein
VGFLAKKIMIYLIGSERNICYGHGDYRKELVLSVKKILDVLDISFFSRFLVALL